MKTVKMKPSPVGPVDKIKWAGVRLFMRTIGSTSRGVAIGFRYGFDSGTMLDHVYRNRPEGRFGLGKILDRQYLNAIGWRAIRNRRELLQEMLRAELDRNRAEARPTRLLDVAAGPGRYLQELLQENPQGWRVLCRDLVTEGLDQGRREAVASGLTGITFEQGDALNPASTEATLGGPPNVIVVSGLFEQFEDDQMVIRGMQALYNLLEPGGAIFVTTQLQHPQLDFIVNVMINHDGTPWRLTCRYLAAVEKWLRQTGFSDLTSRQEPEGLCAVTVARK